VLALCEEALISSTKGAVRFDRHGRHTSRVTRTRGSEFEAAIRMTRDDIAEVARRVRSLITPTGVTTHRVGCTVIVDWGVGGGGAVRGGR
jgi:hypothetical protein